MQCQTCELDKPETNFRPRSSYVVSGTTRKRARSLHCRKCEDDGWKDRGRCPRCKQPVDGVCQHCAAWRKTRLQQAKATVIEHYGGRCVWCSQSNPNFLTLDHRNNDGKDSRCGSARWRKTIASEFPDTLRLMCFNCNSARATYGDDAVLAALCGYEFHGHKLNCEKQRRIGEKEAILDHYGDCCSNCNCTGFVFLTIDHMDGGGKKHRAVIGNNIYRWLAKESFPSGYRILCWNCNVARNFSEPLNEGSLCV